MEVVKAYGGLPAVLCYPGQLNQVFMNILANAVDAFDERLTLKPTITIFTEQRESNVLIRISDNAGGMPESVRAQIFKHAYTTKAVGKGTGLGLSIARQIMIEKHSGDLRCTSTLTKGTEFSIVLPVGAIAAQTF